MCHPDQYFIQMAFQPPGFSVMPPAQQMAAQRTGQIN
jgi:hypothetical protein